MLVVRRLRQDGGPDAGTPLSPMQPVERSAKEAQERGGESNGVEGGGVRAGGLFFGISFHFISFVPH